MRNYVVMSDCSINTLEKIRKDFQEAFNVDLNDDKYFKARDMGLDEVWRMIIQDCFGEEEPKNCWDWINEFKIAVDQIEASCIDASDGFEMMLGKYDWRKALGEVISGLVDLPNHYNIYEADVWVDALFTISYLKSFNEPMDDHHIKRFSEYIDNLVDKNEDIVERNKKTIIDKRGYYIIPFDKNELVNEFCGAFIDTFLNDKPGILRPYNIQLKQESKLFGTDDESKHYYSHEDSMDAIYPYDSFLEGWSYNKIKEVETSSKFKVEDVILFHKAFKDILVENAAFQLENFDVGLSEFRPYLYSIVNLEPISWQLLMSCIIICMISEMDRLKQSDFNLYNLLIVRYFKPLYQSWFSIIDKINDREQLLAQALVYIYYNYNFENRNIHSYVFEEVSENAFDGLDLFNRWEDEIYKDMDSDLKRIKREYADDPRRQPKTKTKKPSKKDTAKKGKDKKPESIFKPSSEEEIEEKTDQDEKESENYEPAVEFRTGNDEKVGINWDYAFMQMEVIWLLDKTSKEVTWGKKVELKSPTDSDLKKIAEDMLAKIKEKKEPT